MILVCENCVSKTWLRVLVPTPVVRINRSSFPASKSRTSSNAARFSSSGTSRIDGATKGSPPYRRMSSASSTARRLSKEMTFSPCKPALEFESIKRSPSRLLKKTHMLRCARRFVFVFSCSCSFGILDHVFTDTITKMPRPLDLFEQPATRVFQQLARLERDSVDFSVKNI